LCPLSRDIEAFHSDCFSDIEAPGVLWSPSSDIEALSARTVPKIVKMSSVVSSSPALSADALSEMWSFMLAARTELMLFAVAIVAYTVLFMQRTPKNPKLQAKKKACEEYLKEDDYPTEASSPKQAVAPEEYASVEKGLRDAFENSDYRSVLRYWNTMKKFNRMPAVSLANVVESMQRFKKDTTFVVRELTAFFKAFSKECDMTFINELLESLAKRLDSDLMEKVTELLPIMNLQMDCHSYEAFLNMYFTTRSFKEVKVIAAEMQANRVAFTPRALMAIIKTALKMNDFELAMKFFHELKGTWTAHSNMSPSAAPALLVGQLTELACKEHRLSDLLKELDGVAITSDVVNTMLSECLKQRDIGLTGSVESFARAQKVEFTHATYSLLVRSFACDASRVQALFNEVVEKGMELSNDFAGSLLSFCSQTRNVQLAAKLYDYMKPTQLATLTVFIRFYAENEEHSKACDVYEQDLLPLHGKTEEAQRSLHLDPRVERALMNAALKCGRGHLAKDVLDSSPSDVAKHINMIRNYASEGDLKGAKRVFESLEQSGVDMNSVIYNTVLDACVECRDLAAAEAWMEHTKQAGMADVVSFNTLIKAHLHMGSFEKARGLVEQMRKEGMQPNRVTFNELINAMVGKGGNSQRRQMWDLIDEMKLADVKPNQVTISILLKSLNAYSQEADVLKTMDLIDTTDEPMDEVLLSSVVEACVRIGKPDLLESKLKLLQDSPNAVAINGSHTYGSLIKAYGHAKDMKGIWRCWKEMRSRHIKPTSITLGCMVEAIVCNGDTEGAFDLIHQIQDDDQCSSALNSVIYCSVLKGFAREKKLDRAWVVYEEMQGRKVDLSHVMYNTLINACALCGRMDNVVRILDDMKSNRMTPNLITYSTMIKGYCQNGDIQRGFAILEDMKKDRRLKPDEIMYNSLLDGCAQNSLVEEGLQLLQEMQDEGVPPSNFTLSLLVKLMNRARKLDQAFTIVEQITRKYSFRPNVHVYTNLIQACVSNQQLSRGMGLLEEMIKERVAPDSRTYSVLIRGNVSRGFFEQAVGLLKGALGLPGALPHLQKQIAVCNNLDSSVVNEALVGLADRGQAKELAVPLLAEIRQKAPRVRIEAVTQRKVMSPCIASDGGSSYRQGKGKGKGSWDRY
jgi:pentatricopeptide repeat protein